MSWSEFNLTQSHYLWVWLKCVLRSRNYEWNRLLHTAQAASVWQYECIRRLTIEWVENISVLYAQQPVAALQTNINQQQQESSQQKNILICWAHAVVRCCILGGFQQTVSQLLPECRLDNKYNISVPTVLVFIRMKINFWCR